MSKIQKKFGRIMVLVVLTFMVGGGIFLFAKSLKYQKESVPTAIAVSEVGAIERAGRTWQGGGGTTDPQRQKDALIEANPTDSQEKKNPLPLELNLKVPFFSQAPFGNWDYPWQEACEEASVLLVANTYLQHLWSGEQFNAQILKLVQWENQRFGDYKHTDVGQTVEILNKYLNLKTIIHENPTYDDIKNILAKGHLIVMTFAGKRLGNPNYRNGGPIYHAMVIKGYKNGEKLITNDVGTRNGEDYVYSWSTIQNALHDYSEPIESGGKRFIEILPPGL